ncbi:hypothetical protein CJF31_00006393 [Rutstroemia sp. NJR-2017a BVV2]|nr:hypothetical protein CJF31_00006393 [Rutstroemia sp. NJR-2017a BVV2]
MAPTSNSAKALQNRSRPAVALPKAIVPALPLAYGRNQQKKTPARETGKENVPPATAPAESTAQAAAPPTTNVSSSMINGTNEALPIEEARDAPQTTSHVASDLPAPEGVNVEDREAVQSEPLAEHPEQVQAEGERSENSMQLLGRMRKFFL